MERRLLLRFGDLVLKGDNKRAFIKQITQNIKYKIKDIEHELIKEHDRLYLKFDSARADEIIKKISCVPGLYSYSFVYKTENDINAIVLLATAILKKEIKETTRFKIETKRANKSFPLTSQEITLQVAPLILKELNSDLIIVDVKNPSTTLNIEIRNDGSYLFIGQTLTMGGFPNGMGESGLVMLSGGIDSPVASYLAMKQGLIIELFHFESTPLTPLEAVDKVIELSRILAKYMPYNKIKLHLVPFFDIHQMILKSVKDSYVITILRRMMYRLAEEFAVVNKIDCLINGESIGQVASQTISSIKVVEAVTNLPIIRPLVTFDKNEIIKIARKIGTFAISIEPFNDCCSIYVPKHPTTKPVAKIVLENEASFDYHFLIKEALQKIITLEIKENEDYRLSDYGFETDEAVQKWKEK